MWSLAQKINKVNMVSPEQALPGREQAIEINDKHTVFDCELNHYSNQQSQSKHIHRIIFGMGCFWGAERLFWRNKGVVCTSVGYAGGYTKNPSYREVCTGLTGHSEVVQVDFDDRQTDLKELLKLFWESHDPTQEMRQGNDIGTQYRSVIYWTEPSQISEIEASLEAFQSQLNQNKVPDAYSQTVHTEIKVLEAYYFAEPEHQQYLHKNPHGYCGLKGTGVQCIW